MLADSGDPDLRALSERLNLQQALEQGGLVCFPGAESLVPSDKDEAFELVNEVL